jgi:hypothetical protein
MNDEYTDIANIIRKFAEELSKLISYLMSIFKSFKDDAKKDDETTTA